MWAAIFPGQGSQTVGMGRFLFDNFAVAREVFEEASDVLKIDFKRLCFEGPEADLQLTENTQPALVLVSTATFRVVESQFGVSQIQAGAGHSVGEYSAIVAGGGLRFCDALRAVRLRGQAMQKAVPLGEGGMLAVLGLGDEQTRALCHWAETESQLGALEPANFNAPGQVVISGSQATIDWLKENWKPETQTLFLLEKPRVKFIPLAVSAPFHCRLMKPAEEALKDYLLNLKFVDSRWPVIQNVTARGTTAGSELRENLIRQVSGSVLWTQCMNKLWAMGAKQMIEFGSGKVLSGLAKKIDSEQAPPFNINTLDDLRVLEAALN